MRIRVGLVGTGVDGDAYRCPLPSYVMVTVDYVAGQADVDVPDVDIPDHPALYIAIPSLRAHVPLRASVAPPAFSLRWHKLLDVRYAEHAGEFRPVLRD